ncbi:hypothetical protein ACFL0A_01375 [Patescibacteria group bacterium]
MNLRNFSKLLIVFSIILAWASICQAGFGISPPVVNNPNLLRGSHYEKQILLIRGEPKEDLRANLIIEASENPEILNWISVEQGTSFILPKGVPQFPMIVRVDVPKDAAYKTYKAYIDVKTIPEAKESGITVALGARINVLLGVTDQPAPNFKVRTAEILNIKEGCPVKYLMKIENTGNVKTRPTKVEIKIFNGYQIEKLLETSEVTAENLTFVNAFKTKEIAAKFAVDLKPGRYWGEIKVFKDNEVVREDKTFFSVLPATEILGFTISPCDYWIFAIVGLVVLAGAGCGTRIIYKSRKKKRRKKEKRKS